MMRVFTLTVGLLCSAATASGQTPPRFEVGMVSRAERVLLEGGARGQLPVTGIVVGALVSKHFGLEAEFTTAARQINRSYEGRFFSFAERDATREEIERMAVVARRSLEYIPGTGGSAAFTARGHAGGRVDVVFRAGATFRHYVRKSTMTILSVPEGIAFERAVNMLPDERGNQTRGGLLFGLDVPVQISRHLSAAPEMRVVWGGPARVGNRYNEFSLGGRAIWKF